MTLEVELKDKLRWLQSCMCLLSVLLQLRAVTIFPQKNSVMLFGEHVQRVRIRQRA